MANNLAQQLKGELQSRYSLTPTDAWLNEFVNSPPSRPVPLASLASTAHFRLLGTDFTTSLSKIGSKVLPPNLSDVQTKETRLNFDVPVQILDIQDISSSKWSQIEAIERVERGEEIRGREVIRTVPGAVDDDNSTTENSGQTSTARNTSLSSTTANNNKKGSTGPHKILLQDAAGNKVWAFELRRIDKITIINSNPPLPGTREASNPAAPEGMQIGCKLLLQKGCLVRRGLVMLVPENVTVMGGRIDIWDQKWREGRKAQLTQELAQEITGQE